MLLLSALLDENNTSYKTTNLMFISVAAINYENGTNECQSRENEINKSQCRWVCHTLRKSATNSAQQVIAWTHQKTEEEEGPITPDRETLKEKESRLDRPGGNSRKWFRQIRMVGGLCSH